MFICTSNYCCFADAPINERGDYINVGGGLMDTVTLPCDVCANPYPTNYQWSRNGEDINGADGSSFIIMNSTAEDFGNYTCTVTNDIAAVSFVVDFIPYSKLKRVLSIQYEEVMVVVSHIFEYIYTHDLVTQNSEGNVSAFIYRTVMWWFSSFIRMTYSYFVHRKAHSYHCFIYIQIFGTMVTYLKMLASVNKFGTLFDQLVLINKRSTLLNCLLCLLFCVCPCDIQVSQTHHLRSMQHQIPHRVSLCPGCQSGMEDYLRHSNWREERRMMVVMWL